MAKRSSTRRTHVSPGIYYKETEVKYSTKSLGITTLGLAGETVKGPAFQTIPIEDWREYQSYFGGTNTEKFRGSQYPKYELPYIAQEYLKQSKQLEVVRVLGLSGVNAGPAWVLTATKHDCKEGYEYEPKMVENPETHKEEQEVRDRNYPQVYEMLQEGDTRDGGLYPAGVAFSVPASEEAGEESEGLPDCWVLDSYVNTSGDIMYFDDNKDEHFEVLPEGIQYLFGSVAGLETFAGDNEWGESFLSINLDDMFDNGSLTDGCVAIEFTKGDKGKIAKIYKFDLSRDLDEGGYGYVICNKDKEGEPDKPDPDKPDTSKFDYTKINQVLVADDEGEIYKHNFILIPKAEFDSVMGTDAGYDASVDFTASKIKARHYLYSEENADGNRYTDETGIFYGYKSSELKTICIEDVTGEYNNIVIGILRSRGEHKRAVQNGVDECGNPTYSYDGIEYYAKKVELTPSKTLALGDSCSPGFNTVTGDFNVDASNYGRFTIAVDSVKGCDICGIDTFIKREYSVSLNPSDKNYIIKVLGTDPEVGDSDVYVEELYDVALEQLIYAGQINAINHELVKFPYVSIVPEHEPVDDLLTLDASNLTRKHLGKRYLYTYSDSLQNGIKVRISTDNGTTWEERTGIVGHIYTVMSMVNNETGKKEYFYGEYRAEDGGLIKGVKKFTEYLTLYQYNRDVLKNDYILRNCVKCMADDMYYVYDDFDDSDYANEGDVKPITFDFNNYKESYRYSSTPWIVSEVKGSGDNIKLHKLFRFHTISDGDNSVNEVKVSIENIDPDAGTFDVVVRSFYDSDTNPNILEKFGRCSLVPGESNYLGLKIGTLDEVYVSQSGYITVEINEDDITMQSVPCGFLGYPVRNYKGFGIYEFADAADSLSTSMKQPYVKFNNYIDEDLKAKKQYFGMSDLIGIDEDILSYKGVEAYNEDPDYLTPCFHLDARILNGEPTLDRDRGVYYVEDDNNNKQVVDVDGTTGYTWVTVSRAQTTDAGIEPRIGTDDVMEGTIYEDKAYRKFTVCFYGGWDGWDYYRTSRSNGDEYRANKYKGSINKASGDGTMFSYIKDAEAYGFTGDTKVINSDYYAYLAGVKQLDNPKTVTINLFATPGIDYVNQTALVNEIIDIIEEDRGDALYVITTPDKPYGAGDSKAEMYSPQEAVFNLEESDIDTNYACTYYPWEKYYDSANSQYIYLPVTLDVVRNMAYTDNIKFPWFASAGWNRGDVTGVEPKRKLKLAEQDTLYEGRINFVNSFAKEGDRIWGDKNLQVHDGIMNRISKRRLLIRLKNLLQNACVGLLFDPNDKTVVDSFKTSVKSVLDGIKRDRGIYDYYIEVDDSAEARDRLELPAKIGIKPTQILEYIDIELSITPAGVQWA